MRSSRRRLSRCRVDEIGTGSTVTAGADLSGFQGAATTGPRRVGGVMARGRATGGGVGVSSSGRCGSARNRSESTRAGAALVAEQAKTLASPEDARVDSDSGFSERDEAMLVLVPKLQAHRAQAVSECDPTDFGEMRMGGEHLG